MPSGKALHWPCRKRSSQVAEAGQNPVPMIPSAKQHWSRPHPQALVSWQPYLAISIIVSHLAMVLPWPMNRRSFRFMHSRAHPGMPCDCLNEIELDKSGKALHRERLSRGRSRPIPRTAKEAELQNCSHPLASVSWQSHRANPSPTSEIRSKFLRAGG